MTIKYLDSKRISGLSSDVADTVTFEDDFSTNKGWTHLTSNTSVTTKLNYSEVNSTYIRATKDLQDSNALGSGNNMSNNFVIRFELNKTNDATNTANGTEPLIGIASATTDAWANNQDSIGMLLRQDTNQTHCIRAIGADNQYTHQGDSADAAYTWTTGIRYCEVIKNATADTVVATLYSNSDFTGSLVTATISTSGKTFSGLRYLSMRNFVDSGRSSTVWEMNSIQVYNGVTSITSKPTNVQDNSIFVETDTAKRYMYDGTNWESVFQPDSISNLHVWYDANDSSSITKDGSNRVSQWNDKSGNSRHLLQATSGSQPLWVSSAKNSRNVIDFVSSRSLSNSFTGVAQPLTVFIVSEMPVSGGWYYMLSGRSNTTPSVTASNTPAAANSFTILGGSGSNRLSFVDSSLHGTWAYMTGIYNTSSSDFRTGGSSKTTGTIDSGNMDGLTVGASRLSAEYSQVQTAEIIIYTKVLTTSEIETVEAYLKEKWGL